MKHYLWELRPYYRQVAGQLVLGSLCGIVMNTAIVLPAILLGQAIDTALALGQGQATPADVGWAALAYLGGTLATEVPRIFKRWWLMTANARIRANLRADALRGVLAWPMAKLQTTPVGDLMARIIGDVETLGVGVREFIIETWDTVLFSLSLTVAMLIYDPHLTVVALTPVPFAMWLAHASGRWVQQRTLKTRSVNAQLIEFLHEQLQGIRIVRLFGLASAAVNRMQTLAQTQAGANLALIRLREGLKPVYTTLMIAGVLFVVWLGGGQVVSGAMTVGAFVAYTELFLRFVNRGFRIPQLINSVQSGAAAYARLRPLLATALPASNEPPYASFRPNHVAGMTQAPAGGGPAGAPSAPGRPRGPIAVSLQAVTFRYPNAATPALANVSLDFPAGALIAVTGPIGAGKSALARVLAGVYPVETGSILCDGRVLSDIAAGEWAARIGYLPQEPSLFSGSLRANVAFGATRSDKQIAEAVATAVLMEDVQSFPAGLDTAIGEQGIGVSGGQRQRIALARAFAGGGNQAPRLLVLDDPFSALDVDTEACLIQALRQAFGPQAPQAQRATIVVCTHRLAICPHADRVIVLNGGNVVEDGRHVELLAHGGLFARIYQAQHRLQKNGGS